VLGEIYVIGVDPSFHGHGLGRAMTVAGLVSLASRGVRVGMLYVESANAPALGLYYDLGFTLHHVERAFVLDSAERDADPEGHPRGQGRDQHLPDR
jgi:mycothiol synthase